MREFTPASLPLNTLNIRRPVKRSCDIKTKYVLYEIEKSYRMRQKKKGKKKKKTKCGT